jgi:uncharacterized protein with PCYCGC motif
MKKNWPLIAVALMLVVTAIVMIASSNANKPRPVDQVASHPPVETAANDVKTIPAHFESAPSRASLGPTLDPEAFSGVTREAYRAVREIPQTIAQMPCYCHCDRGMGHKSLYSCFEDDHASHCATCVNEALLAFKLQKEGKLTPAQIRDQIVEQFGQ